jgi:hypothetical protein
VIDAFAAAARGLEGFGGADCPSVEGRSSMRVIGGRGRQVGPKSIQG